MAPTERPHFLDPRVIAQKRHDDLPAPTEKEKQEYLRGREAMGGGKDGRAYDAYMRREEARFNRFSGFGGGYEEQYDRYTASRGRDYVLAGDRLRKASQTRVGSRRGAGSPAARAGRAAHAQARSGGEGGDSGGDGGGASDPDPEPAGPHLTPSRLSLSAARRADSAARWLAAHDKKSKGLQKEVTQENRARREQARCSALTHDNLDVDQANLWTLPAKPVCGLSPKRWAQLAQLAETKSEKAVAPLLAEGARVIEIAERLHRTRRRIEQIAASLRRRAIELTQRIEARRGKPPLALKQARRGSLPLPARAIECAPEQMDLFREAA